MPRLLRGYQIRTIEYGKILVMLVYGEYYGRVYEVYNKSTYILVSMHETQYVPSKLRGRTENSLHQEKTNSEWFSQSKYLELWPYVGIKRD